MEVSCGSLFIYQGSPILFPALLSAGAWVWDAAPRPRFVLTHWPERNERSLFYERQEIYI